jgi:hypothetical protein
MGALDSVAYPAYVIEQQTRMANRAAAMAAVK